ncbi:hypothetical protein E3N88_15551 [Mikania micrantha]|uniref:Protein kinase domain-containing protein n=1 Tax=Mikania micrantha TaxID=192012 RepID=A0A5N6NXJ7_9ASTR|nr:hypothetical protein E3N88_15551 [Mikania micrantha]
MRYLHQKDKVPPPVKFDAQKAVPTIEVPALSLDELKEKTQNFGSKALIGEEFILQATPRLSEDKVKQCIDPRLKGEYPPKAVAKLAAVAALCVQYESEFRPNMSIVVKALQPLLRAPAPTVPEV